MRHNHENGTSSESSETDDSSLGPLNGASTDDSATSKSVFGRRGYLGLLGAGVVSTLAGCQSVNAQGYGYGLSEHGLSEYGSPENGVSSGSGTGQVTEPTDTAGESETESPNNEPEAGELPNVLTVTAERDGSSVRLSGLIWSLDGSDSARASFEYRPTGSDQWSETDATTLSRWGAFERTISDLPPSTQYEYRAVVTIDEEPTVGDSKQFHTLDAENTIFDSQ